ncbi:MAG: FAD binding domain-containing protein [Acidobacteria bacterium]|nr:FAD binding domain-containing protein [Acidobacteriota bacterium]
MIQFYLNDQRVETDAAPATPLLDFIRTHRDLVGTKAGCREGDCGACCVLLGYLDPQSKHVSYQSITSCLFPLGNVHGTHVVTVEGLQEIAPNPVQTAMVTRGATQCGFCTPGFVMSWMAFALGDGALTGQAAEQAIDGNICRCTGYQSLKQVAQDLTAELNRSLGQRDLSGLVSAGWVPAYFSAIPAQLASIPAASAGSGSGRFLAGGTDLLVQIPEQIQEESVVLVHRQPGKRSIRDQGDSLWVDGSATVTDLLNSPCFDWIPNWTDQLRLISSTPIRNIATVAGNLANASPIGDLSILFLAMDAEISVGIHEPDERRFPLADFFLDYKKLLLNPGERIWGLTIPKGDSRFQFLKVSKRTYLDIASVNSAMRIWLKDNHIQRVALAAGGVAPVPLYLRETSRFLEGKKPDAQIFEQALAIANREIAPISDVRGSAEYKRLLLTQQLKVHFETLFRDEEVAV